MLQQQFDVQQLTHDREMDLMQATIDAQEQEQNRIGKDLHDDLGAMLTASRIQIQQIERYVDKESELRTFVELSSEMVKSKYTKIKCYCEESCSSHLRAFWNQRGSRRVCSTVFSLGRAYDSNINYGSSLFVCN